MYQTIWVRHPWRPEWRPQKILALRGPSPSRRAPPMWSTWPPAGGPKDCPSPPGWAAAGTAVQISWCTCGWAPALVLLVRSRASRSSMCRRSAKAGGTQCL